MNVFLSMADIFQVILWNVDMSNDNNYQGVNHRSASAGCLQMKHQKSLVLFKKNGLFPRICLHFLGICLVLQCTNGASAGQFYSMNSPLTIT
ncbi:CLUMA_CG015495, isoform A [Clunio marinus]|uniref:CLUMA_CG015495, isoform A n=1 Tax=Clunio marinus TaxID=568069 RepID=A0A1J1IRG8_9DIPT|nr:CLUMA_CG015495, isoform A [Clunio marinus]